MLRRVRLVPRCRAAYAGARVCVARAPGGGTACAVDRHLRGPVRG